MFGNLVKTGASNHKSRNDLNYTVHGSPPVTGKASRARPVSRVGGRAVENELSPSAEHLPPKGGKLNDQITAEGCPQAIWHFLAQCCS